MPGLPNELNKKAIEREGAMVESNLKIFYERTDYASAMVDVFYIKNNDKICV